MSAQLQDQLQDQLHKQLDILFASLEKEWDSPMVFSLHLGVDCATNSTTHQVDICKFLSGEPIADCPTALASEFAYFCRKEFPPPNNPSLTPGINPFMSIRSALEAAALQAGFELVSEGSACSKKVLQKRKHPLNSTPPYASIRFTCNKFRAFRKRKMDNPGSHGTDGSGGNAPDSGLIGTDAFVCDGSAAAHSSGGQNAQARTANPPISGLVGIDSGDGSCPNPPDSRLVVGSRSGGESGGNPCSGLVAAGGARVLCDGIRGCDPSNAGNHDIGTSLTRSTMLGEVGLCNANSATGIDAVLTAPTTAPPRPPVVQCSYRKSSLHNDKTINSRGRLALSAPRRSKSQRSLHNGGTCSFNFAVYLDECGFLLKKLSQSASRSLRHCNHLKRLPDDIPTKIKQLSHEMKIQCAQLFNSHTRPSAARNFINTNHNLNLTDHQVRFAMRKFNM